MPHAPAGCHPGAVPMVELRTPTYRLVVSEVVDWGAYIGPLFHDWRAGTRIEIAAPSIAA